jgi:hypothetical protein
MERYRVSLSVYINLCNNYNIFNLIENYINNSLSFDEQYKLIIKFHAILTNEMIQVKLPKNATLNTIIIIYLKKFNKLIDINNLYQNNNLKNKISELLNKLNK